MSPAPPNWFYVYLLKGKSDGSIYIGCTSNLRKRLEEHKKGKIYSTEKMLPVELIYFEAYNSKKAAFEREKRLKHYGSALRHLKLRIIPSLKKMGKGGAG
jgi:putative endonuclease